MLSLALLRHAKSSWDATDIDDFDRPLNDRGRTAAPLMGAALQELNFAPELILCSSAKRTRETLGLVTPFVKDAKVMFDDQLYLTSQETLYARLKAVPTDVKRVLMIGHNPGMHGLALFLTMLVMMPVGEKAMMIVADASVSLVLTGTGDAKSISRLEDKFPTAALAVFSFEQTSWQDILPASGHLEAFLTPRDRA